MRFGWVRRRAPAIPGLVRLRVLRLDSGGLRVVSFLATIRLRVIREGFGWVRRRAPAYSGNRPASSDSVGFWWIRLLPVARLLGSVGIPLDSFASGGFGWVRRRAPAYPGFRPASGASGASGGFGGFGWPLSWVQSGFGCFGWIRVLRVVSLAGAVRLRVIRERFGRARRRAP